MTPEEQVQQLRREKGELQARLTECEETLDAIRQGAVDAVVVGDAEGGMAVYALETADYFYRVVLESMSEGVVTVTPDGLIVYCNDAFSNMLGRPHDQIIGTSIYEYTPTNEDEPVAYLISNGAPDGDRTQGHIISAHGNATPVQLSLRRLPITDQPLVSLLVTSLAEQVRTQQLYADLQAAAERETYLDEQARLLEELRVAHEELQVHRDHLEDLVSKRTGELLQERESLRATAAQLARVEQNERQLMAAALHDSVGQTLAFMRMKLGALKQACDDEHAEQLAEVDDMLQKAIEETRSLTVELAPPVLNQMGLEPALEWLAGQMHEKHGYQVHFHDDRQPKPIDDDARIMLYQAARELLTNAAKHSSADNVWLSITRQGDEVELVVADDGSGFDPQKLQAPQGTSFGLFNISQRIAHLGGRMETEAAPGRGARFRMLLPLVH